MGPAEAPSLASKSWGGSHRGPRSGRGHEDQAGGGEGHPAVPMACVKNDRACGLVPGIRDLMCKQCSLLSLLVCLWLCLKQMLLKLSILLYSILLADILFHAVVSLSFPFIILRDNVLPAILAALDALGPAMEVICGELLSAFVLFLSALLPPLTAFCCMHFFLLPCYFKLVKFAWCAKSPDPLCPR
ncbi:hypothetical protein lerEdw1_019939 [Lerista edwardsae]|nr:hypothetical protein lerEdw1_019939 [Lerista edwardsae]